ncbi:hypothetical protein DITRI_Ditri15bG0044400 [Diplodiscus trichospermus]
MFELGIERDTVTFSTLINGLCIEGKVAQAARLLDDKVRIGDTDQVVHLAKTMGKRGIIPNIVNYNH